MTQEVFEKLQLGNEVTICDVEYTLVGRFVSHNGVRYVGRRKDLPVTYCDRYTIGLNSEGNLQIM